MGQFFMLSWERSSSYPLLPRPFPTLRMTNICSVQQPAGQGWSSQDTVSSQWDSCTMHLGFSCLALAVISCLALAVSCLALAVTVIACWAVGCCLDLYAYGAAGTQG
jgi:hypothetical protein